MDGKQELTLYVSRTAISEVPVVFDDKYGSPRLMWQTATVDVYVRFTKQHGQTLDSIAYALSFAMDAAGHSRAGLTYVGPATRKGVAPKHVRESRQHMKGLFDGD